MQASDWQETAVQRGLRMEQPALRWQDALPVGSGAVGALVFGHICEETITLNHEGLWHRSPKPKLESISEHLPQLRQMLMQGDYTGGETLLIERLAEAYFGAGTTDPFHPLCDLQLRMDAGGAFQEYSRTLDFSTGTAHVDWTAAGSRYRRSCFVSRASDTVVLRVEASKPESLTVRLGLVPTGPQGASGMGSGHDVPSTELPFAFRSCSEHDGLTFLGQYPDGREFGAAARVLPVGGRVTQGKTALFVEGADEILVLVRLFVDEPGGPALDNLQEELRLLSASYDALWADHVQAHRPLFAGLELDLGLEPSPPKTNEELLAAVNRGEDASELLQRMFDMGRYLLLSSSRPGGLPANLQGVWNGDYRPAWSSDYHNDENIQMNYWPALPGNLAETTIPYFDYYESMLDDFRTNAEQVYGCRGILVPIAQTTHGLMYGASVWAAWTAGAGWLAQLFYDYWLFTGDREFLADRAVPFMKEVVLFYEDFLIEDDKGQLVFVPSLSPENRPSIEDASLVTINATMDVAVAREVLQNLCEACRLLGVELENVGRWESLLARLPEYEINEDGAVREWLYPGLSDNYHHRHQSHIYPLFPGFEVTEETNPELFASMQKAVEKRLVVGLTSQTGWSFAHMANIYARLGDGERALECLCLLCRSCVGPNLFTYHNDWRAQGLTMYWGQGSEPPFQIDANFGLTAAVLEMLVFSASGLVKLLPALPAVWTKGSVEGVQCRGGLSAAIRWDCARKTARAVLVSTADQTITVKLPWDGGSVEVSGGAASGSALGSQYLELVLQAEKPATIELT